MAFPRGASAFETEETRAETPEASHAETPFVFATDDALPPRGDARGLGDPSSDSEDEHADAADDDAWLPAWFRDDARRETRSFDRADRRRPAASLFRDVCDTERFDDARAGQDHHEKREELFSRRDSLRALAATVERDEDERFTIPSFDEFSPDDARLDGDMLRRIRWLTGSARDSSSVAGGFRSSDETRFRAEDRRAESVRGFPRTRRRSGLFFASDDATSAFESNEDDSEAELSFDASDDASSEDDRRTIRYEGARVSSRTVKETDEGFREGFREGSRASELERDGDAFHDALLALYRNWSLSDRNWFFHDVMDEATRDRFDAYLESSRERLDAIKMPTAFPDADAAEAAEKAADAFERVFGRAPASEEDFRLCVAPFEMRDIETGKVTGYKYPRRREDDADAATGEFVSLATGTKPEKEKDATQRGTSRTDVSRNAKCLYFDAQGWCPLGVRCPSKEAHVARRPPLTSRSVARESLRQYWDAVDDPDAPLHARLTSYPYASFRNAPRAVAAFERLLARDDASRASRGKDANDDEAEPVWSSPARRRSRNEASTRV